VTNAEGGTMTETTNEDLKNTETHELAVAETKPEIPDRPRSGESPTKAGSFRQAGYVVLFIAAVLVINAMETGSYRTPWPVALGTALLGLGLLGYSWYLQSRPQA